MALQRHRPLGSWVAVRPFGPRFDSGAGLPSRLELPGRGKTSSPFGGMRIPALSGTRLQGASTAGSVVAQMLRQVLSRCTTFVRAVRAALCGDPEAMSRIDAPDIDVSLGRDALQTLSALWVNISLPPLEFRPTLLKHSVPPQAIPTQTSWSGSNTELPRALPSP